MLAFKLICVNNMDPRHLRAYCNKRCVVSKYSFNNINDIRLQRLVIKKIVQMIKQIEWYIAKFLEFVGSKY